MSTPARATPDGAPRTLADQLRGWPDERLRTLLTLRPDLAVPPPQDSAQLAARVVARPSVVRALDGLSRLELTVVEAALHLAPTSGAAVVDVVRAEAAATRAALERLVALGLLWGPDDALRPVSVLAEVLDSPTGPDISRVPALRDALPPPARALLDHLDAEDADGRTDSPSPALAALLDAHLVAWAAGRRRVLLPWSVRVALRDGRSTRVAVDVPPDLATADRTPSQVDRAAAGAAFEAVRRVELLLDHWGTRPPPVLRTGGLGVRELKAASELLGVEPGEAGLLVEVAASAGLLAPGAADDVDPGWLPTDAYDQWLALPPAARWERLARAWLDSLRHVGLVGGRDDAGRPVNALSPDLERIWLPTLRHDVLSELATARGGLAAGTGPASLIARLRWRRPRRPAREAVVLDVLAEAARLGVTGRDGLASYGRVLVDGGSAADGLAPLLPHPVDHVLIQADLTAVAPGPLTADLARSLGLVADVESRGGATVYRFTAGSVRRALDAGWSAVEVKDFLRGASRTPVPQALDYLVEDVSRRFGTLRAGVAESFLRSDDEAALTELLHAPGADQLRLRRIAPTVLVSDVPLGVLLPRLRDLGAAPVVEAADGTVRVARPDVFRARSARRPTSGAPASIEARRAAREGALVASVRAGDRVAASRPSGARASSPGDVLALLGRAAETGASVRIGYVDGHGRHTEEVVRPARVESGQLLARVPDPRSPASEDDLRVVAVHRIAEAALVE